MKRIRGMPNSTPGLSDYLEVETESPSWEGFRSHWGGSAYRGLVEELTNGQHGLCGYCEMRLADLDRQVEHVVPRSDTTQGALRALDFRNLIACCKGGTARSDDADRYLKPVPRNRSCGEAKDDYTNGTFIDPRDLPALPSLVRVLDDGAIEADAAACADQEVPANRVTLTIQVLNLNAERLRVARQRHWDALRDAWGDFFGDPDMMLRAARSELLPRGGRLRRFFTTSRCYFGLVAERVLDEPPRAWS